MGQTHEFRRGWVIGAILLLAFALRVAAAMVHPVVDRAAYPDAGDYHDLGAAIAKGADYRVPGGVAVRMPGYPVLIAGIYKVCGERPAAVLIAQAAMGAAACWFVYLLARRVSEKTGLVAAGLAAVDPLSIVFSASLLSEAPYALALVMMLWAAVLAWEFPRHIEAWLLIGLTGAAGVYLRASSLYLPAVVIAAVLARHTSWASAWRAAVAVAVIVAALLPWKFFLARHVETAGLKGMTSLEGISLYEAVYEHATGGPMQGEILRQEPAEAKTMREADRDAWYRAKAWEEIWGNPGRVAGLAAVKLVRTWSPGLNAGGVVRSEVNAALWAWHVPLFVLAVMGAAGRRLAWPVRAMAVVAIVYFAALHMVFMGSVRYRVPLHPVLCMLAAVGVATWVERRQRRVEAGVLGEKAEGRRQRPEA